MEQKIMAWIEKKKGWTGKKKRETPPAKTSDDSEIPYGVTWIPIKSPCCHTKNIKIDSTVGTVRYCTCNLCKRRFKATEIEEK